MSANIDWLKLIQNANGGPLPMAGDPTTWGATQYPVSMTGQTMTDTASGVGVGGTPDWSWLQSASPMMFSKAASDPTALGGETTTKPVGVFDQTQPAATPSATPAASAAGTGAASPFSTGYDVWQSYQRPDERPDWNYANDPMYDASKDHPYAGYATASNRTGETDRERVWRDTLDALGPDPGSKPAAQVQAAFMGALRRLREDYLGDGTAQHPGRQAQGQGTWADSAFAKWDPYLGTQGFNTTTQPGLAPPVGAPATTPPATTAATSGTPAAPATSGGSQPGTGGTPVNPTAPMGSGLVAGANSSGGNGTGSSAGYDQLMQTDQAFRTAQLMNALGLGDINSRMSYGGSVIANQAPKLFEAWRQTQGLNPTGTPAATDWNALLHNFSGTYNSPGAMGNFQQAGQNALNTIMQPGFQQGMTDQELMNLVQGFEQLVNAPTNDVMARYRNNLTDQGVGQFLSGLNPQNLSTQRFVPYLQGNPIYKFLTGGQ